MPVVDHAAKDKDMLDDNGSPIDVDAFSKLPNEMTKYIVELAIDRDIVSKQKVACVNRKFYGIIHTIPKRAIYFDKNLSNFVLVATHVK